MGCWWTAGHITNRVLARRLGDLGWHMTVECMGTFVGKAVKDEVD